MAFQPSTWFLSVFVLSNVITLIWAGCSALDIDCVRPPPPNFPKIPPYNTSSRQIVSSCEPEDFECQQREQKTRTLSSRQLVSSCKPEDFECQQREQKTRTMMSSCQPEDFECQQREQKTRTMMSSCQPEDFKCQQREQKTRTLSSRQLVSSCQPEDFECQQREQKTRTMMSPCEPENYGCQQREQTLARTLLGQNSRTDPIECLPNDIKCLERIRKFWRENLWSRDWKTAPCPANDWNCIANYVKKLHDLQNYQNARGSFMPMAARTQAYIDPVSRKSPFHCMPEDLPCWRIHGNERMLNSIMYNGSPNHGLRGVLRNFQNKRTGDIEDELWVMH